MNWRIIGQCTQGTSHLVSQKECEDAMKFGTVFTDSEFETLICCISDGAGSATYAKDASEFVTTEGYSFIENLILKNKDIKEPEIFEMAEYLIEKIKEKAVEKNVSTNEFSCTFLGAVILSNKAIFFQIGDGAIVCLDECNNYYTIWFPQNGEYQNTTHFLIDDTNLRNFQINVINQNINEVAIFTDGLQQLTLNFENLSVHQPFFNDMFKWLRLADNHEKVKVLNSKLKDYLNSEIINERTDDDKSLFLASRFKNA